MAYPRAGVAPLRNVGVYPGLVAHLVRDEGGAAFKSSHSDQHLADLLLKSATTCATTCPGRRDGRCRCSPPDRSYRRNTAGGEPGLRSSLLQHMVRSHLLDAMCRTREDRQARQDRDRYLTEGPALRRGGWLRCPATAPRSFATSSASSQLVVPGHATLRPSRLPVCPDPSGDGFDDVNRVVTIRTPRCAHLSLQRGAPP